WAAYATWTYGSPIPHSVTAKAGTYVVEPWVNLAAIALGAGLPGFSLLTLADGEGGPGALAVAAIGLVTLLALERAGARLALARTQAALPLLLFAPLYALAYTLAGLRGVRMFQWYLVPLVPSYALAVALGAAALARHGHRARVL